ncbi:MAG: ribosome silencing factor [Clostridia bacterium]|nr:ribosome silencing factor [Clostridia bacterium]
MQEKIEKICSILQDGKAEDIVAINVKEKTSVADCFIIAGGRSMTHTKALAERVEEEMEKVGVFAKRTEGAREGRWVVIDYGDILVHLFNDESRLFYHLEQLWGDDKNTTRY